MSLTYLTPEQKKILVKLAIGEGWFIYGKHRDAAESALQEIDLLTSANNAHAKEAERVKKSFYSNEAETYRLKQRNTHLENELNKANAVVARLTQEVNQLRVAVKDNHEDRQSTERVEELTAKNRTLQDELAKLRSEHNAAMVDASNDIQRLSEELERERQERLNLEVAYKEAMKDFEGAACRAVLAEGQLKETVEKYDTLRGEVAVAVGHLQNVLQ